MWYVSYILVAKCGMVKKKIMTSVVASNVGRWAVVVEEETLCIGFYAICLRVFSCSLDEADVPLFSFCCWVHSYSLQRFSLLLFLDYCLSVKLDL